MPKRLDVAGAHRKVLVAPEGGRQRFDLEMRKVFEDVAPAAAHVTEVEEERHLGVVLAHRAADPLEEGDLGRLGESDPVVRAGPVEALGLHLRLRPGAYRDEREADVDEDPVGIGEELHRLLHLPAEIVEIGRGEVEKGPAGTERLAALADQHALGRHHAPARMLARRELVPTGREVHRRVDAGLMERVDLRPQEIEIEVRVLLADLGRVVRPAVMAFGEDGDRIDVGVCERPGEVAGVEAGADPGNAFGGMEVQVDLAIAHGDLVAVGTHLELAWIPGGAAGGPAARKPSRSRCPSRCTSEGEAPIAGARCRRAGLALPGIGLGRDARAKRPAAIDAEDGVEAGQHVIAELDIRRAHQPVELRCRMDADDRRGNGLVLQGPGGGDHRLGLSDFATKDGEVAKLWIVGPTRMPYSDSSARVLDPSSDAGLPVNSPPASGI